MKQGHEKQVPISRFYCVSLPIIYVLGSGVFLFNFSYLFPGSGFGVECLVYPSLPLGLLGVMFAGVPGAALMGIIQYALIGYFLDRWRSKRRRR